MKTIFEKSYSKDELYDVERDVSEALQVMFNPAIEELPTDAYGFTSGIFTITITWEE